MARTYGTPSEVSRDKEFPIRITLPLTAEMLKRADGSLKDGEKRLSMIRTAIDRELTRRERDAKRKG